MRRGGICLAAAAAVLAFAGCGGDEPAQEEPRLSRAVAERLAEESDAVADLLDAGDQCGAAQQADVLEEAVEQAIAGGDVPAVFQDELLATARGLQNEVNCPQPPPAPEVDCDALEEEKRALEEQKEEAEDEEEKKALEEQIKALDEQLEECEKGGGEGNGNGNGGNGGNGGSG